MDQQLIEAVETAALNAWPAPRQMLYDGWLLRFTGGSSKRVNSVNIRGDSSLPLDEKIALCEVVYARQNLPIIFRLPDPWTSPALLRALDTAGYQAFDPTFVLGRDIKIIEEIRPDVRVEPLPDADWLQLRAWVTGTPLVQMGVHAEILKGIVPEKVLMGLFVDGKPYGCGMGVLEGGLLGYFSIYTRASARRQGYGRAMMAALTRWGAELGATFGYLQVEGDNKAARELYAGLGYQPVYKYLYSVRPL